ncbi:MAG: hypothetical protein SCARUB_04282 [Candidatus Scalindua rubra]|uniref:Glycosyltransferase n=1 Tax=Candidatus Scalindua rubra TaxID=1872076 RepID=A0A1E3X4Q5_9BACT|nr:MAG: hypothetical protein SCARUB_04282 [Candidatus Scalindua rubra]
MPGTANPNIAIIESVGAHGGMNYYDIGLCEGLLKNGVDIILYTCDKKFSFHKSSFIIKPFFRNIYGKRFKFFRFILYIIGLNRVLWDSRIRNISLVHFHFFDAFILEYINIWFAKFYGFKIVVTVHDVENLASGMNYQFAYKIYNKCDKIIVHNEVSRKELVNYLNMKTQNIRKIPHGNYIRFVNTKIQKNISRRKISLSEKDITILFFGQIKKAKGLDLLLRSLSIVKEDFPTVKLLIAGKVWKDDFNQYQKTIKTLGIKENVIQHIKYIPDKCVKYYFSSADLVVLPYRKIYQSGVLLMAMSYKKPVLVSDIDGMTEIIQNNVNGFLFRNGDSNHLAKRIIEILSNPQKSQIVSQTGYETVEKFYDWKTIGYKTSSVYKEII